MEFLQSLQAYLAMLGLTQNQSLFNLKFFVAEIFLFGNVCSNSMFIICEANTFREYACSSFVTSTYAMAAVCFTIFAKERKRISEVIEIGTELIEKSE